MKEEAASIDGPQLRVKHAPAATAAPGDQLITLHVPKGMLKQFDDVVTAKQYPNRSEAIRLAMHDLIMTEGSS